MKFLGLLGMLLWLGTLPASAVGTEKLRAGVSFSQEWCGAFGELASSAGHVKSEKAEMDGAPKAPLVALASGRFGIFPPSRSCEAGVAGAGAHALRELLIAWHLGQGPPAAGA